MLSVIFLVLAGLCFGVEAFTRGRHSNRVALTPLGLLFLTAAFLFAGAEVGFTADA